MRKVTVTGNIVSQNGIVLFMNDGTSQVLAAHSYKTQAILDAVLPSLGRMQHVEIDLDAFSLATALAKATGGAVKLSENGESRSISGPAEIKDATPLNQYIEDAALSGSKGFQKFLSQFGNLQRTRSHSSNELLTFMKGADLPIADDGSIIGYKVLRQSEGETMVDHNSGRVTQKLGSIVFMPASKITGAGRDSCGVGLHIAARSYLSGFWYNNSSRLCLVKIKADDVISVPPGEHSKMRVCAYHIVKAFDKEDGEKIAMWGADIEKLPSAAKMLADAVAGNHTPIIQRVEITGDGKLTVTDLTSKRPPRKERAIRPLRSSRGSKVTVASAKAVLAASWPYERKLKAAQKDYDNGMSIRDISKKYRMDRESLGKNLLRKSIAS